MIGHGERPSGGSSGAKRRSGMLGIPLPIRVLLAQSDLLELAHRCSRDGVEEDERVGQPPLRKGFREERAEFFGGRPSTLFEDLEEEPRFTERLEA